MREMKLQDLKSKTPPELLAFAEEQEIENASTMRKQELMFAILKQLAAKEIDIIGEGVVEVLSEPDPPLRLAHRRYHRRSYPLAERGRTLLRAAQDQHPQFRGPREGQAQD